MPHKVHMLKTWPEPFAAIRARMKRFEFRKDDRDYEVGDTLWLSEFDPATGSITGENEVVLVTYLLREGFGIPPGYVVMSIDHADGSGLLQRLKHGSVVFLDGRNEHGSHVLASFPTDIPDLDDDLAEQAEMVLTAAEALGFAVGQHVWARFVRINDGGGFYHWEFVEIDADLTREFFRAWGWDGQEVATPAPLVGIHA